MEKDMKEFSSCIWYCYGKYCSKDYKKETKLYGYSDLTEHRCYTRCKYYRKNTWYNRLLKFLFF